jgi:hypothetical protein
MSASARPLRPRCGLVRWRLVGADWFVNARLAEVRAAGLALVLVLAGGRGDWAAVVWELGS